jgi:hypothetical protein
LSHRAHQDRLGRTHILNSLANPASETARTLYPRFLHSESTLCGSSCVVDLPAGALQARMSSLLISDTKRNTNSTKMLSTRIGCIRTECPRSYIFAAVCILPGLQGLARFSVHFYAVHNRLSAAAPSGPPAKSTGIALNHVCCKSPQQSLHQLSVSLLQETVCLVLAQMLPMHRDSHGPALVRFRRKSRENLGGFQGARHV